MVVLGVLLVFEKIMNGLFSLLPNPAVPGLDSFAHTITDDSWFGHLAWANNYFPLDVVLSAAVVVWGAWTVLWVFRLTIALLVKLHVLGGNDD